jgi:hypothetical protein
MNTTYTSQQVTSDELTVDGIAEAIKYLRKPRRILERIEISKKGFAWLNKNTAQAQSEHISYLGELNNIGALYGIKIVVKPYLKKVRMYYSK